MSAPPTRRTTPGPVGYLAAVVLSVCVVAVGLVVLQEVARGEPLPERLALMALASAWAAVYVGVVALPFALLGVAVVHLACRAVEAQWVHVLAAGTAGLVSGLVVVGVLDAQHVDGLRGPWPLVPLTALATALGRAAVIPLRPPLARPWPEAGPGPVDDDFRSGRPGC